MRPRPYSSLQQAHITVFIRAQFGRASTLPYHLAQNLEIHKEQPGLAPSASLTCIIHHDAFGSTAWPKGRTTVLIKRRKEMVHASLHSRQHCLPSHSSQPLVPAYSYRQSAVCLPHMPHQHHDAFGSTVRQKCRPQCSLQGSR